MVYSEGEEEVRREGKEGERICSDLEGEDQWRKEESKGTYRIDTYPRTRNRNHIIDRNCATCIRGNRR